jgi:hypothetical protein
MPLGAWRGTVLVSTDGKETREAIFRVFDLCKEDNLKI